MANRIQVRRGTAAQLVSYGVLTSGEFGFSTDTKQVHIGDGSANNELALKTYVDSVAQGLSVLTDVGNATTANVALTGEQTIDGVLTSTSRILVKNQTAPTENGVYVTAVGAWARAADMDAAAEVSHTFVFVTAGTVNADTGWVCTNEPGSVSIGVDNITFAQFSAAGQITAGTGLAKTGNTLAVVTVLEDLITLGANAADSEFLVGTAAGALAWESGATVRTSLGLAIGTDVLAQKTIGIADNNLVEVDATTNAPADTDYAAWTATGLEGRDKTQMLAFLNVTDGADVTDATSVAAAGAVMDSDITAGEGFLRMTGAGTYVAIKSNLAAAVAPAAATDDVTLGYGIGSIWIDTTADKAYVCLDATDTAAVWTEITQVGGAGSANTALSNLASVAINAALIPGTAGALDFGSTAKPWADLWFAGQSGTPASFHYRVTGTPTTGVRTLTFPDASGGVLLDVSIIDGGSFS